MRYSQAEKMEIIRLVESKVEYSERAYYYPFKRTSPNELHFLK